MIQHEAAISRGAMCGTCPLYGCGRGPVMPSVPVTGHIPFLVVGEAPSGIEVDDGRTLAGPSGRELRGALEAAGAPMSGVSYTNAILCRPENSDLARLLRECNRRKIPTPIDCCAPRLQGELDRADFKLYVGATAVRAVGAALSILEVRGTPIGTDALATLHPGFVLQDGGKVLRGVFRYDVAKAVRLARGGNTWKVPSYDVVCNSYSLAALLNRLRDPIAIDTETDGIDPWTCNIRRIGISDGKEHIIFAPLSVTGTWLMDEVNRRACWKLLANFFQERRLWRFHNYYGYDSIVLRQHGIEVNETHLFDSLVGHHVGSTSEYPHSLAFLGSIYTDSPAWKGGIERKDDATLNSYLASDLAVTHAAAPHVVESIRLSQQWPIYELDAKLSVIARSMSGLGVRIDPKRQVQLAVEYQAKAAKLRGLFVEAAGRDVNPGSVTQVKDLLYQRFGLPVLEAHVTETGEPSTAEPVLLSLLEMGVEPRVRKLIHALLGWREAEKLIGTYLGRIAEGKLVDGPRVHRDGRIRTTWKVYGTTSGRWSSGDPMNLQNVPKLLRSMFVPAEGNVFVGADYSAVELRILALLANDEPLIEAFRAFDAGEGPDIHVVNAMTIFKCDAAAVTDEPRTFAKRFVYGLSYGAGPPKIFQTLSLLRDEDFAAVFATITLPEIEHVYKTWWAAHPAIASWQKQGIAGWRKLGYMETPWSGRRRYFLAGENKEEMANFRIQGGAADLQNAAVLRIAECYPPDFSARTGLVLQIHDANVIECRADAAPEVKKMLEQSMVTTVRAMRFPAVAKAGTDWSAV